MIFKIDGGDGDQAFFEPGYWVETGSAPWFDPAFPRGQALLLRAITGIHAGRYLAITSRVPASIDEQIASRGMASVILHTIEHAGDAFAADTDAVRAVGMTVIARVT